MIRELLYSRECASWWWCWESRRYFLWRKFRGEWYKSEINYNTDEDGEPLKWLCEGTTQTEVDSSQTAALDLDFDCSLWPVLGLGLQSWNWN